LLTDGRFSGGTRGPCVGHISPEAAEGGALGLVRDGDTIELDIPGRNLRWKVDEKERARRQETWRPPPPKVTRGYLARYANLVTSVHTGAVLACEARNHREGEAATYAAHRTQRPDKEK